jgi:hypothetical protein
LAHHRWGHSPEGLNAEIQLAAPAAAMRRLRR